MIHECLQCNYSTSDSGNWARHKRTIKHINKTNSTKLPMYSQKDVNNTHSDSDSGDYGCKYCGLSFTHQSSLYRHMKNRCKEKSNINETTKVLREEMQKLEERNERLEILLGKLADRVGDDGGIIKTSVNALTFLMTKHKKAPALKEITLDNAGALLGYDGDIKMIEKIVHSYKNKKLDKFIGSIIIKCYKKDNPDEQSIWNSDVSRLTYLIKDIIGKEGESQWIWDKKGVKVSTYIIKPILNFILPLLKDYVSYLHKNHHVSLDPIRNLRYMEYANLMIVDINSGLIEKTISRYISAHFQLNITTFDDNNSNCSDL